MPKSYANTLLVILNSRFRIDGGRDDEDYSNMTSVDLRLSQSVRDNRRSLGNSGTIGLQRMNSAAGHFQGKSSYDTLSPENTAGISKADISGSEQKSIQIIVQNEVITDAVDYNSEQTEHLR